MQNHVPHLIRKADSKKNMSMEHDTHQGRKDRNEGGRRPPEEFLRKGREMEKPSYAVDGAKDSSSEGRDQVGVINFLVRQGESVEGGRARLAACDVVYASTQTDTVDECMDPVV